MSRARAIAFSILSTAVLFGCGHDITSTSSTSTGVAVLPKPAFAVDPGGVAHFYVSAHPDSWMLFMGDHAASSWQASNELVFIYTSAGDQDNGPRFYQARESGSQAAVNSFAGAGAWTCGTQLVDGHAIERCVLGKVVSYYMRMPDGNMDGAGFGHGSMELLRDQGTPTNAIDGSATYASWADFYGTIGDIIDLESAGQSAPLVEVNTHEYDRTLDPGDHADFWATADAVRAASATRSWNLNWYVGYDTKNRPANVSGTTLTVKDNEYQAYDNVMVSNSYPSLFNDGWIPTWRARTYFRSTQSAPITTPPEAPTALTATAITGVQIDLHWSDNSQIESGFTVELAPDNGGVAGPYTQIASLAPNTVSYSSTGLTAGTRYWFRVRAFNAIGNSAYTNEASATTLTLPAAPTNLVATASSATQIDLQWTDNATSETAYLIERAPDNAGAPGAYTQIASLGANVTTYSNTGLSGSTRYWYRIRASNAAGNSAYSNDASATTPAPPPPAAPTGLTATGVTTTQINLQWTDNATTETAYLVERAPDNAGVAGTYAQIASVGANVTTYSNTGLTSGTRYWYRVRASNGTGTSAYSNEVSATTLTPPPAPTNLVATAATSTQVNLQWTDNATTETGFLIERAPDNAGVAGTYAQIASVGANVVTFSNTGLTAGTRYWYRVRATNSAGNSGYSNETAATTLPPPPPPAPTGLSGSAPTSTQVNLQWTDNATTETGFSVERAPDNAGVAGTYVQVATLAANVTTFTDGGLVANTRYWYRVAAFNAGGNSGYSNSVAVTTLASGAAPIDIYIHAHQDDWQLFMGDRAARSWQTTAALVLIYTTAGDAGNGTGYYEQRELGAQAAFEAFAGAGTVTCTMRTISGHPIRRCVLGKVVSYYMRLPDGNTDGTGFGFGSIEALRDHGTATSTLDGTTKYTSWADFYNTIGSIVDVEMTAANATFVNMNAPEYDRTLNPGDHADHWATGDAVLAASQARNWNASWYVDYDTRNRAANVSGSDLTMKNNEFQAYDNVMAQRYPSLYNDGWYPVWRQRTYFRAQTN